MKKLFATTIVGLLLAACGLQESSPVPQPVPFYLRRSTPSSSRQETLVLGLPGAVAGRGRIQVRDRATSVESSAPTSGAGSFAVTIGVGGGSTLEARFQNEDGLSDPVELLGAKLSYGPVLASGRGETPVSSPDPQGLVTVTNDAGAGQPLLVEASPLSDLLLANATTAEVVTAATDAEGRFKVTIPASRGDVIQLLLVDRGEADATSDYLSFTVP